MFNEINIRDIKESPVKLISDDWGLIAAGNENGWNTMTVSWGALGEIWGKDAAFVFIRPQRHTFGFFEREELFTISFFAPEHKDILKICGSRSGRDCDKAALTGLKPVFDLGSVAFEQAEYTLLCKKLASQFLDPKGFADLSVEDNYSSGDYHKMYIGEIIKVFKKS